MVDALGIDIGGTKIRAVLLRQKRILKVMEIKTPVSLEKFVAALKKILLWADGKKLHVGIAVPGVVQGSSALFCPNIGYLKNFNFRTVIPKTLPLFVDHDARCFLRSEHAVGAAQGRSRIFGLILGTGIGRAYLDEDEPAIIQAFEKEELWEKEYIHLRKKAPNQTLATFLADHALPLIHSYNATNLLIGGGVLLRPNFFTKLRQEFRKADPKLVIFRSRFKKNGVAYGAATGA